MEEAVGIAGELVVGAGEDEGTTDTQAAYEITEVERIGHGIGGCKDEAKVQLMLLVEVSGEIGGGKFGEFETEARREVFHCGLCM